MRAFKSEIDTARAFLVEKLQSALRDSQGAELSRMNQSAIDLFAAETLIAEEIMKALHEMVEIERFTTPENIQEGAKTYADKIL